MSQPTIHEQNAAARAAIADRQAEARGKAVLACGLGAKHYAAWTFVDRLGYEPNFVVYCASFEGRPGWHPSDREAEARHPWLMERVASVFTSLCRGGRRVEVNMTFRWETRFHRLDEYRPLTAEQLQANVERREEKRRQRELESYPLFAGQIREEQSKEV